MYLLLIKVVIISNSRINLFLIIICSYLFQILTFSILYSAQSKYYNTLYLYPCIYTRTENRFDTSVLLFVSLTSVVTQQRYPLHLHSKIILSSVINSIILSYHNHTYFSYLTCTNLCLYIAYIKFVSISALVVLFCDLYIFLK